MRRKILVLSALLLTLMFNLHLNAQDVYIDLSKPRQSIDGAGFCHEGDRQNGNYYIISANIQEMLDNNMTLFRDMFPNRSWEPSKGTYGYSDARVTNCLQRLKIMQDRGIKTILGIWDVPNWLVSNPSAGSGRKINNYDDFAWLIYSFLKYGKDNYGLQVNYIDVNETKTSAVNIGLTAAEYSTFVQKCSALFSANGISTKINLGSTLLWDLQYNKDLYNAAKNFSNAGVPSWHTYRGGSTTGSNREPISYWENWGAWQQTLDRNLWGTETDYDAYYWYEMRPNEVYSWIGVEEMAVMYWRNYYVARMSTSAGWFWNKAYPSHNVHLSYMNNFDPGGQIVETSQPTGLEGELLSLAYKHAGKNKFVIQVINQSTYARTVNFYGVPAGKPLTLKRTSEAGDRGAVIGTYTPNGTTLTITLQANSFNTLVGELASTDLTAPSIPGNLNSPSKTTTSVSLAWNASTDNVGVVGYDVYNGGAYVGTATGTSYTVNSLTAATSYTFTVKAKDAANNYSGASNALAVTTNSASLAFGKPVTASSTEAGANVAANAVDGNSTTRWSSLYSAPQSIYVDLGSAYSINQVKITWEAAYATAYEVQVSNDASIWTSIKSVSGNASLVNDHTGLTGSGRYVRIYCTTRVNSTWGFSIFELEVYGTKDTQSPTAPANLRSTSTTTTAVSLAWDASTDNTGVAGYDVYNGGVYVATATGTTYTVNGLTAGTTYTFTAKAKDAANNYSGASNSLVVTTTQEGAPIGSYITLQGNNSMFVCSENGVAAMTCVRSPAQAWEKFLVVDAGNGLIALKGNNGLYVSSENGATTGMTCNRATIQGWETFTWVNQGTGKVSLKASVNSMFVTSNNGVSAITCNKATAQGWEIFNWAISVSSAMVETDVKESVSTKMFSVYPTSVINQLMVTNNAQGISQLVIVDLFGRKVMGQQLAEGENTLNLSALKSGMYLVMLKNGSNMVSEKIIKQ